MRKMETTTASANRWTLILGGLLAVAAIAAVTHSLRWALGSAVVLGTTGFVVGENRPRGRLLLALGVMTVISVASYFLITRNV